MIKVPKCYRDTDNQSCTDLILTNKLRNFQNSCIIETLTSYFHKMTVSAWRMQFRKLKPRVLFYEIFINSLKVKLSTQSISLDENGFLNFCKICTETLNKCAPRKRKTIRANLSPFWIWKFQKLLWEELNSLKKGNVIIESLLRKSKRNHYINFDGRDSTDNKKFWKIIKPLFSDKPNSAVSINLKVNKIFVKNQN